MTWADGRAAPQAERLVEQGVDTELHERSGTPVHPFSPLAKTLWFAENESELTARVRAWAGLKEVVLHHLTGTLVTELSSASGTGLLDLRTGDWSAGTLESGVAGLSIGTSAALQVETVLRQLETVHPVEQIRATGGVFRSDLWRDVLSAVLDRPLVVAAGAEGSGLGAAALGARALGLAPDLDAALQLLADEETLTGQEEVIEPDPERVARYDRLGDQVADTLERLPRAAEVLRAR